MEPFPPNSRKAEQRATTEPKKVERVTSVNAVRRRKPLGKQFSRTFFGGDARSAFEYMIGNVLVPAAKEAIVEAASSGFERFVYGDTRSKKYRGGTPVSGPTGYVAYSRMGPQMNDRPPKMLSRQNRSRHDFDDIVINSRQEAEDVLDRLYDLISKCESASIADLYELTGLDSSHTDHKWGWVNLRGSRVARVRSGGYRLELPAPEYFD